MNKKEYLMQCDCLVGDENKLWYIASRFSSLMEINRMTGEVKELFSLEKEGQYRSLIKDGNKLLLFPAGAGRLWIYDIADEKIISCSIPKEVFYEGQNWSAKYIRLGNCVYFNWESPVIVKYNLSDNKWQVLTEWRKWIPRDCQQENWFPNEAFFHDGFLYFQIGRSRLVLRLNPDTDEFDMLSLHIPKRVVSINNITFSNGELWMECQNNDNRASIYCCRNWSSCQCEKILELDIISNNSVKMFSIMEKLGDKLLLLPGSYDRAFLIHIKERKVYETEQYPVVSCDRLNSDWFSAFNYYKGLKLNKKFLVVHSWTHQLIETNEDRDDVKRIPIIFMGETLEKMKKNEFEDNVICNEGILELRDFLRYVCCNKN